MSELILPDESYRIIGACFEVYNEMGCGFLEAVYQESLEHEFSDRGILFVSQPELPISFKERRLNKTYKPDFICFKQILIELKAVSELADDHRAQIINYLHASKLPLGMLINFSHYPKLQYERLALTRRQALQ